MKTTVVVTVRIQRDVYLDVEHDEADDPCDLTDDERKRAIEDADAGFGGRPWIDIVEVRECAK